MLKILGWTLAVFLGIPILVLVVYAIFSAVVVLLGFDIAGFPPHVGSADGRGTGEIGDTFGGLLGPVLTAAALGATVWFSHRQIQQTKDQIRDERLRTESERAESVIAWIAETPEDYHYDFWRGVVVVNDSKSPLSNLDLSVVYENGNGRPVGFNRLPIVPPGAWFVPFEHRTRSGTAFNDWFKPSPIAMDDGMSVKLGYTQRPSDMSNQIDERPGERIWHRYELTSHVPVKETSVDGKIKKSPYLVIAGIKFILHGKPWKRSTDGAVHPADGVAHRDSSGLEPSWPDNATLETISRNRRYDAGVKPRELSTNLNKVEKIVRTILTETTPTVVGDRIQQAYGNRLDAQGGRLERVDSVELVDGKVKNAGDVIDSTKIRFHLTGGGRLDLTKNGAFYPGGVAVAGHDTVALSGHVSSKADRGTQGSGSGRRPGAAGMVRRAGSTVLKNRTQRGEKSDGGVDSDAAIEQTQEFWLKRTDDLFSVLQAMVDKAVDIIQSFSLADRYDADSDGKDPSGAQSDPVENQS